MHLHVLGICGTYHLANGLTIAVRVFGVKIPEALRRGPGFWVPVGAGLAAVGTGVAAFSGAFFPIDPASWGPISEILANFYGTDLETIRASR